MSTFYWQLKRGLGSKIKFKRGDAQTLTCVCRQKKNKIHLPKCKAMLNKSVNSCGTFVCIYTPLESKRSMAQ